MLIGVGPKFLVLGFLHFVFIDLNFLIEGAFLGGKFKQFQSGPEVPSSNFFDSSSEPVYSSLVVTQFLDSPT